MNIKNNIKYKVIENIKYNKLQINIKHKKQYKNIKYIKNLN